MGAFNAHLYEQIAQAVATDLREDGETRVTADEIDVEVDDPNFKLDKDRVAKRVNEILRS